MSERPSVSVVIPSGDASRDANLERLQEDLRTQTLPPTEVEIVRGVAPNGRARNVGVSRTVGDILVFLDDDVRLGSPDVLERLVSHLQADPTLGMVGTAQQLPPDSTPFQRRCARQISRSESPVVSVLTESDMVTTQCCAMRRAVLDEVGGFHDRILRGVDPELRHRVRAAGYRIAVVPEAWHYHPMPGSLRALLRMAWRNGHASAYARRHFPETVLYNPEGHVAEFEAARPLSRRVLRNAGDLVSSLLSGHWIGLLYRVTYVSGNLMGSVR
ncbi:MAG: glycosyltransferase [Armatimonadetes bacterium]|nr:glycosyltransferase [Armatimonadota bacterium]